jgi:tetratricopeptide (TPR) repeat protein
LFNELFEAKRMPRKVKIIWVLCCIAIFLGFSYLSAKNRMQDIQELKQEDVEKRQQKIDENKRHQELKAQFQKLMGEIRELNVLGKYDQAAETASRAAGMNPKSADAYTWWGFSLAKSGKIKEAYEKFDQSSRLDPNQTKNYYFWGLTLLLEGKNEKAIDKFENALLLDPENSKAYASWGAALNNLKKYDEAIKKLEEALAQNSFNRSAYGVLVDAHFHKGQYQQAWEVVARARKNKIDIKDASLKRLSDASPEPH